MDLRYKNMINEYGYCGGLLASASPSQETKWMFELVVGGCSICDRNFMFLK